MQCPKAVIFDLDDTLSPPHVRIASGLAGKVERLLTVLPVGLATAAPFSRIERDFISALNPTSFSNLYIFSENGAQCRTYSDGKWIAAYEKTITEDERMTVRGAIQEAIDETGALEDMPIFGERILDREAGVTLSTLGLGAPQDQRESWDPDKSRRMRIYYSLVEKLPAWNIYIGGLTSVDISRKDVNKGHAVVWLTEHLQVGAREMLYIGDALYEGGNDEVVIPTGVQTRSVKSPTETETVIDELLEACSIA